VPRVQRCPDHGTEPGGVLIDLTRRLPPPAPESTCLRIGVIASIAHRTPPRGYGPWEQVASTLTEGLVALGHDVTLFATADSLTSARLHAVAPHGYEEDPGLDAKVYEGLHIAAAFERAGEFDVISNQFDFLPLTYSRLVSTPVVTTIHGFSSEAILPVYRAYDDIARYADTRALGSAHGQLSIGYTGEVGDPGDANRPAGGLDESRTA
jgi:Glycosyltransferase Family 4